MVRKSVLLVVLILLLQPLGGCERDRSIRIGFIGSITGKNSDLGVTGRDAVQLAVETVNNGGGINGRPLLLSVQDDGASPDAAVKAVERLAAERVAAIVGPMGSSMAKAVLPVASREKIVLVSPTSSSNELSGKDDHFFRVMEPNLLFARHLADTCLKLKIRRVAAIYDLQNQTYTVEMFRGFKEEFVRRGGTITAEQRYDSARSPAFMPLVRRLGLEGADGVMILANNVDSIIIGQQIRKLSRSIPIISGACGIAQRDLLQQAGKLLDNVIFTLPVNGNSTMGSYTSFRDAFVKRFNYQPTFASVLAYDAAQAIITALRKDPDPTRLRETIRGIGTFPGLQGEIALDSFGDPHRQLHIIRFTQGREEVVEP